MSRGLLTIMATITHLGLVVLTIGVVSYATNRDVVVEQNAGTLLGPAMVLASMASVFFPLARSFGVTDRDGVATRILQPAIAASLLSYVGMLVVGSGIYALERHEGVWFVLFAGRYAGTAFVIVASLWAGVTVAAFLLLARLDSTAV